MILDPGTKVLIVHRRLFENDKSRYFVGTVQECEGEIATVSGHTWVQDQFDGRFSKKEDVRTKIIALSSPGLITYRLPSDIQAEGLSFTMSEGKVWLTDDKRFRMDLSESNHPSR